MNGISLLKILDIAPVSGIQNVTGVSPRTLMIRGTDFRAVEQVLIHGYNSPEFIVVSQTELLAQVPSALVDTTIYDVTVMSSNFTLTDRSLLTLDVGSRVRRVSGILRLLQTYIRMLIRTQGTNIFNKQLGGSMMKSIGTNVTQSAISDVSVAISKTTADIIAQQSLIKEIPPTERLLSATVSGFYADPENTTIFATITITNHSGVNAAATISA